MGISLSCVYLNVSTCEVLIQLKPGSTMKATPALIGWEWTGRSHMGKFFGPEENGVWCKSRVYCCNISHYLVKTTLGILGQQIWEEKIWVLIMWMVFLANLQRWVPCSRVQSAPGAVLELVAKSRAPLGLLRPSRSHHLSREFIAPITQPAGAIQCLPQAMRTEGTLCTTTPLTRTVCSAMAAVIRVRDPTFHRKTSTGCTPGCRHQVWTKSESV